MRSRSGPKRPLESSLSVHDGRVPGNFDAD